MTNVATGQQAERVVAEYLEQQGYVIVDRNWKTRYCEVDIIAQKAKRICFVEVKYRKTSLQGSGLEYITARKLDQMRFAAEMWVQANGWRGDYLLSAAEVTGREFTVSDFISDCN